MEKFASILGITAVTAMVMAGALNAPSGAVQRPGPGTDTVLVTYRAEVEDGRHGVEVRAISTSARDRAILDHEWYEGMQERCTARSPFAGVAPAPPAC